MSSGKPQQNPTSEKKTPDGVLPDKPRILSLTKRDFASSFAIIGRARAVHRLAPGSPNACKA